MAWEKRQALLRRKRSRAQSRGWGPFGGGGGGGETEAAAGARAYGAPRGERSVDVQRATAVAAATAARRCSRAWMHGLMERGSDGWVYVEQHASLPQERLPDPGCQNRSPPQGVPLYCVCERLGCQPQALMHHRNLSSPATPYEAALLRGRRADRAAPRAGGATCSARGARAAPRSCLASARRLSELCSERGDPLGGPARSLSFCTLPIPA